MRVVMALTESPGSQPPKEIQAPGGCSYKDYSHKLLIYLQAFSLSRHHMPQEAAQIQATAAWWPADLCQQINIPSHAGWMHLWLQIQMPLATLYSPGLWRPSQWPAMFQTLLNKRQSEVAEDKMLLSISVKCQIRGNIYGSIILMCDIFHLCNLPFSVKRHTLL